MVQTVDVEPAPQGSLCAAHPEIPALWICDRCGNFVCETCSHFRATGVFCSPCQQATKALFHLGEASKLQRFINVVIDTWIGAPAVAFMFAVVFALTGHKTSGENPFLNLIVGVSARLVYYVSLEGLFGTSLGKIVTGTKVISAGGQALTLRQSVLRTLTRFVPFDPFSFLSSDRGWHDRWTGTRVVRTRGPKQWDADVALR